METGVAIRETSEPVVGWRAWVVTQTPTGMRLGSMLTIQRSRTRSGSTASPYSHRMHVTFREFDSALEWVVEDEFLERSSHALVADGAVWIVDPVDGEGAEERIRAAGQPAGVIQLLDRHNRDSALLAARLGIPHYVVPREPLGPFTFRHIRSNRRWDEVALGWEEERV